MSNTFSTKANRLLKSSEFQAVFENNNFKHQSKKYLILGKFNEGAADLADLTGKIAPLRRLLAIEGAIEAQYLEALATAILFILPDPYQPLGSKFEVYLLEELINAHSKYTVSALGGNK